MIRKRHRVAVRSKIRTRRFRHGLALSLLVLLGMTAFLTVRHMVGSLPSVRQEARRVFAIETFQVLGGAPKIRAKAQSLLAAAPGGVSKKLAALRAGLPCLKEIRVTRDWFSRSARFELVMRRAVARVGQAGFFLSEEGVVFEARPSLYAHAMPEVDPGEVETGQLSQLADAIRTFSSAESGLTRLARMEFVSAADGWNVLFDDGTRALWGDLRWTAEKPQRLRQALEDARSQASGRLTADLRYFEDGRILLTRDRLGEES